MDEGLHAYHAEGRIVLTRLEDLSYVVTAETTAEKYVCACHIIA